MLYYARISLFHLWLATPVQAFFPIHYCYPGPSFGTTSSSSSSVQSSPLTRLRARGRRTKEDTTTNVPPQEELSLEQRLLAQEDKARVLRLFQAKQRLEKAANREDRIAVLQDIDESTLTDNERAELGGLLRTREHFSEHYNPEAFSEEHHLFKRKHNQAFVALTQYCQGQRTDGSVGNFFYLEGPDQSTTAALVDEGRLDPSQCYVANFNKNTCRDLRLSGGGRLPDENVVHLTAAEALTPRSHNDDDDSLLPSFSDIDFCAYYFDGCGGFVPHVINMMQAALLRNPQALAQPAIAIGFSLVGGTKDAVVQRELEACRALAALGRTQGRRTVHVLDEPGRYGIPQDIAKTESGTFTTWMLLEPDE